MGYSQLHPQQKPKGKEEEGTAEATRKEGQMVGKTAANICKGLALANTTLL